MCVCGLNQIQSWSSSWRLKTCPQNAQMLNPPSQMDGRREGFREGGEECLYLNGTMTTYMRLFSIYQLQFQLDDMNLRTSLCSKGLVTPYTYILFVISCVLWVCSFLQSDNLDPSFAFLHYYSHLSCWLGSHSSRKFGNCRLRGSLSKRLPKLLWTLGEMQGRRRTTIRESNLPSSSECWREAAQQLQLPSQVVMGGEEDSEW